MLVVQDEKNCNNSSMIKSILNSDDNEVGSFKITKEEEH